ncbi:RIIa domain-containing protein 1 [Cichlidogyrus casuarinus]|uniref:RIIa domain-containing protein 1 n=1 Tax=Cichlidogyrus casuarinus TaxID=1844966 RepID=A0ABD2Q948_9PLAT
MNKAFANYPSDKPPHGMEDYDIPNLPSNLGALNQQQQYYLNELKTEKRIEANQYLLNHPEVNCLLISFMRNILKDKPNDVREYSAQFFNNEDLPKHVEEVSREIGANKGTNSVLKLLATNKSTE